MNKSVTAIDRRTGLILSGGGARAAYQVGVLKAVADILPRDIHNPFDIICGTSAGAINATAVATHAARFRQGIRGLEQVWRNFTAEQVYRTGSGAVLKRSGQWLSAIFLGGIGAERPASLLDNSPLRDLLTRSMRFERIGEAIDEGNLRAFSITASGYTTGQSVSFFQGAEEVAPWRRARRLGVRAQLGVDHLMASSAIPAVFPAVRINREYFGDGSVRQVAPISPALHLGADRVMVIGVSGNLAGPTNRKVDEGYPSVAQVMGHLLNSAFLDTLESDVERLERVNHTISLIPPKVRAREGVNLRPVDVLLISPSEQLDEIAAAYAEELPRLLRYMLRGSGATRGGGSTIISYLLFEQGFCRALIDLGYNDAMRRENEILRFLGFDPIDVHGLAGITPSDVC